MAAEMGACCETNYPNTILQQELAPACCCYTSLRKLAQILCSMSKRRRERRQVSYIAPIAGVRARHLQQHVMEMANGLSPTQASILLAELPAGWHPSGYRQTLSITDQCWRTDL